MKKVLYISLVFFVIAACNPAKQIMKNQTAFEQLGQAWAQTHPCANDTTIATKSDTIIQLLPGKEKSIRDTVYQRGDTVMKLRIVTDTIQSIIHIRDTVINSIVDVRQLSSLDKELSTAQASLTASQADAKATHSKYMMWLIIAIISFLINILLAIKIFVPK